MGLGHFYGSHSDICLNCDTPRPFFGFRERPCPNPERNRPPARVNPLPVPLPAGAFVGLPEPDRLPDSIGSLKLIRYSETVGPVFVKIEVQYEDSGSPGRPRWLLARDVPAEIWPAARCSTVLQMSRTIEDHAKGLQIIQSVVQK